MQHNTAKAANAATAKANAFADNAVSYANKAAQYKTNATAQLAAYYNKRAAYYTKQANKYALQAKLYKMRATVKTIVRNVIHVNCTVYTQSKRIKFYNIEKITAQQLQCINTQLAKYNMHAVQQQRTSVYNNTSYNLFVYCNAN